VKALAGICAKLLSRVLEKVTHAGVIGQLRAHQFTDAKQDGTA